MEDRNLNEKEKTECYQKLEDLIRIRNSTPSTSKVVFGKINQRILSSPKILKRYDSNWLMKLIETDGFYNTDNSWERYDILVLSVLVLLVKNNHTDAINYLWKLLSDKTLRGRDISSIFELLEQHKLAKFNPKLTFDILNFLNSKAFGEREFKVLFQLLEVDLKFGKLIIDKILKPKNPDAKVLLWFSRIFDQNQFSDNPRILLKLLKPYLLSKKSFRIKFKRSPIFRRYLVRFSKILIQKKYYKEAIKIFGFCLDDPDPSTNSKKDNPHRNLIKPSSRNRGYSSVKSELADVIPFLWVVTKYRNYTWRILNKFLDFDNKLAKKLGYSNADLSVRQSTYVSIYAIAKYASYKYRQEKIKPLYFKILKQLEKDTNTYKISPIKLNPILEPLSSFLIKDFDFKECKKTGLFLEKLQIETVSEIYFHLGFQRKWKTKIEEEFYQKKCNVICSQPGRSRLLVALALERILKITPNKDLVKYEVLLENLFTSKKKDQSLSDALLRISTICIRKKYKKKEILDYAKEIVKNSSSSRLFWQMDFLLELLKRTDLKEYLLFIQSNLEAGLKFPFGSKHSSEVKWILALNSEKENQKLKKEYDEVVKLIEERFPEIVLLLDD